MRVVLDTNVFVSGIFFTGPPYQILKAWRNRTVELVLSQEILEEYRDKDSRFPSERSDRPSRTFVPRSS